MTTTETLEAFAERMVRNEVQCCVTSLVSTLAGGCEDRRGGLATLVEQAAELAAPVLDYESAAIEAGWQKKPFGRDKVVKWWNPANDDGSRYCDKESSILALCEDHDIEPHGWEVYEHWAVSTWFAEKLAEHGEKVDTDFTGLNVWARTTTGQAIEADEVVLKIARECMEA